MPSRRDPDQEKAIRARQERQAAEPEPGDDDLNTMEAPTPVTAKRPPGKKDTNQWCKGKVGREHQPAIQVPPNAWGSMCQWRVTSWAFIEGQEQPGEYWYSCRHAAVCTACQKVLRRSSFWFRARQGDRHTLGSRECPDFTPRPVGLPEPRP